MLENLYKSNKKSINMHYLSILFSNNYSFLRVISSCYLLYWLVQRNLCEKLFDYYPNKMKSLVVFLVNVMTQNLYMF